jgi:uncharacterized membrane protein
LPKNPRKRRVAIARLAVSSRFDNVGLPQDVQNDSFLSAAALLFASSQIAFADEAGTVTGAVRGDVAGAVVGGPVGAVVGGIGGAAIENSVTNHRHYHRGYAYHPYHHHHHYYQY